MDYLGRVEKQLDLPPSEKAEVMKELRTHYEEFVEELVAAGMDREQAEEQAAEKFGRPEDIAAQMSRVHTTASWQTTALAAVPFIFALLMATVGPSVSPTFAQIRLILPILVGFVAVMLIGIVREFRHDRRPIWLATWLAAAVVAVARIADLAGVLPAYAAAPATTGRPHATAEMLRWGLIAHFSYYAVMMLFSIWLARKWPKLRIALIIIQGCLAATFVLGMRMEQPLVKQAQSARQAPAVGQSSKITWVSSPVALRFNDSPGPDDPRSALAWLRLFSSFLTTASWIAVALAVFAFHRRGNACTAALFLFALSSLYITSLGRHGTTDYWQAFLRYCVPVVGLIIFCWATDWRVKIAGLGLAVAIPYVILLGRAPLLLPDGGALLLAFYVGRVILLPVLLELPRRTGKPEPAT